MESVRIQTVLRLPPELMERVKRRARKQQCSFNSYVEKILDLATGPDLPHVPHDFEISEEILALGVMPLHAPSAKELEHDPKLARLWKKYGKE